MKKLLLVVSLLATTPTWGMTDEELARLIIETSAVSMIFGWDCAADGKTKEQCIEEFKREILGDGVDE